MWWSENGENADDVSIRVWVNFWHTSSSHCQRQSALTTLNSEGKELQAAAAHHLCCANVFCVTAGSTNTVNNGSAL